ncbi:MAG: hypothetical protein Ta2B_18530 [Termitinemataceae bacterium]|nr:MAG: hypothetical protein Ta2B_18530 [Termitinemataceae bacterium]
MARPDKARETLSVFTDKATGRGRHNGNILKKVFASRKNPPQSCVPLVFIDALTEFYNDVMNEEIQKAERVKKTELLNDHYTVIK